MRIAVRPTSVAVLLAVGVALGSVLNRFVRHGLGYREPAYQLDLDVYRHGAMAWLQGLPIIGPYDIGPATVTEPMPFTYPPIAAVLFVPTTWAPWGVVMAAWTAASIAALLVALALLARAAGTGWRTAWMLGLLATGLAVNLEPFAAHLQLGQIGIFLMALTVIDLADSGRRRSRGILLGLAIAIKLNPAVFGLYLLLRRDWRALGITAASALGFTALGWVLAPRDSAAYWRDLATLGGQVAVFEHVSNISLAGLLDRLPLGGASTAVWSVVVLVTIAVTARAMLVALRRDQAPLALALNGLLVPLISPVAWEHHWVWLAALLVLFLAAALQGGALRGGAIMASLALATALLFRETGVSGFVPGSWVLYLGWAGLVILLLNWSASYPAGPDPQEADSGAAAEDAVDDAGRAAPLLASGSASTAGSLAELAHQ